MFLSPTINRLFKDLVPSTQFYALESLIKIRSHSLSIQLNNEEKK